MKPAFPEPNLARSDLKRKGKEKVMEAARPETRWRDGMHGVAYCDGTCQPGPCCSLFPRLPDGKVILPDPLELCEYFEVVLLRFDVANLLDKL